MKVKVHKRSKGQTVTYGPWEWLYAMNGIRPSTRRQIEELTAQGEVMTVTQWPSGEVIFSDGKWKANRES